MRIAIAVLVAWSAVARGDASAPVSEHAGADGPVLNGLSCRLVEAPGARLWIEVVNHTDHPLALLSHSPMNMETPEAHFGVRATNNGQASWRTGDMWLGRLEVPAHGNKRYPVALGAAADKPASRLEAHVTASIPAFWRPVPGAWVGELECGALAPQFIRRR